MLDLAMIVVLLGCLVFGAGRGALRPLPEFGVLSARFSIAGTFGPPDGGGAS